MATTELPVNVEKNDTSQPFSKNFDQFGNSSGFIFDVSLSTAVAANGKNEERVPMPKGPLSTEMLDKMNRYWRAANYLCIGQIYLFDNPLLRLPLTAEQIKPRLLGHWGTSPGQNFIYIHLNRLIKEHDADIIYISGPGHGGPSLNACSYLEGSYTEVHPESRDEDGLRPRGRRAQGDRRSAAGRVMVGRINPEVFDAAQRFADGAITDQVLADVAAMKGLPLYVARSPLSDDELRRHAERRLEVATQQWDRAGKSLAYWRNELAAQDGSPRFFSRDAVERSIPETEAELARREAEMRAAQAALDDLTVPALAMAAE